MVKLTQAQMIELIKALVGDVEVAEEADKDLSIDGLLSQIDQARKTVYKPQIEEELKAAHDGAFKGRMIGSVKAAINRVLNLKLDDNFESVEDMLKKALDTHDSKYSTDTESLRKQLKELSDKHGTELSAKEQEWQAKLSESESKFIDRDIDEILMGILKEIPRVGGNEINQAKMVKQYLRENFHLHYDPQTKSVEPRQKDKPENPVYNQTKTQVRSTKDLVTDWCNDMGLSVKDMRNVPPVNAIAGKTGAEHTHTDLPSGFNATLGEIQSHVDDLLK